MTGTAPLAFACACRRLRGTASGAGPAAFTRILCHCGDCRSACVHLGQPDPGRVDILQTSQSRIAFSAGDEHLRVFRHTPRGALRWYAACCGSPLFHTPLAARLVHAGLNADRLDIPAAAGPVLAEIFLPAPGGLRRHRGALRMVSRLASRALAGNFDGTWRDTPFFDANGNPVRVPTILGPDQRSRALAALRG